MSWQLIFMASHELEPFPIHFLKVDITLTNVLKEHVFMSTHLCFVGCWQCCGGSSFAALHSRHEDHPLKPQWHHHLLLHKGKRDFVTCHVPQQYVIVAGRYNAVDEVQDDDDDKQLHYLCTWLKFKVVLLLLLIKPGLKKSSSIRSCCLCIAL